MEDKILNAREAKINFIKQFLDEYDVVTLKANIPGLNKINHEAIILTSYFNHLMLKLNVDKSIYLCDEDGPMYIYIFKPNTITKDELMTYEDMPLIGRFIDLDLFKNKNAFVSVNRSVLRKCYLCDDYAFVCIRNRKHNLNDLLNYIDTNLELFLNDFYFDIIATSMLEELDLDPKFGLVTKTNNGSHQDMNYDMMKSCIPVICKDITKMFMIGYHNDDLDLVFKKIRKLGLETEKKMLEVTNGINTYKGLIFVLGCISSIIGNAFRNNYSIDECFDKLKLMCKGISDECKEAGNTFGKYAYQKYGITGARGEVEAGLPNVKMVLSLYDLDSYDEKIKALMFLIANVDDTVLLKRCGDITKYQKIKTIFRETEFNSQLINQLTNNCIKDNLSFGGSADLLIVSIVLYKLKKIFNFL